MTTQFFKEVDKEKAALLRRIKALQKKRAELAKALPLFPVPDFLRREIKKLDDDIASLQADQRRITPARF